MTGNKIVDYVIIALSMLFTFLAIGYFAFTNMIYEKPGVDNQHEFNQLKAESSEVQVKNAYEIKRLIVNLSARSTRLRYIEMNLHLVPFKSKYLAIIEKYDAQIKDSIIEIAGKMSAEEINSISGKILLESRVKNQINLVMGKPVVKQILFSKFTVQ